MDSGNSGSLQSSSGGDDEFDSRCGGGADSSPLSALLRQSPSASASPSMAAGFGGSFYGLQELASPPFQLPPPMSQAAAHQWTAALPGGGGAGHGAGASSSPSSSPHGVQASAEQAEPAQQGVAPPVRGSRKRTRASRRAPTTVLTTDTSNFRAMVQEFTGIPSPPFTGAPARSRFDHLFPAPSSLRSAAAAGGSPSSLPAYLLRPFAQKLHPSPFPPFPSPSTSSPSPSNIAIAASTAAPSTKAVAAPGDRYQLASAPSSSLLGIQDHGGNYLSFERHLGAQLGGDVKYTAHPMFDAPGRDLAPPAQRLQDPADFLGLTHGIMGADGTHNMHHQRSRNHGHGGDELSGVVGGASMTGSSGGCKKTTYSSNAGAPHAAPQLERNAESTSVSVAGTTPSSAATTTAMRTQSVDSWICTSE
ncbi:hypothetical protein E2562_030473 [Oryza meyeriana var. granulata]|uniref:VQ domain-containing protein n=1 Tax=Oryza meyeriana var. granulata TaxID=110450 RepID=A0A6G1CJH6_9ORYZ|nr:hypothetical protein E2562_030473 [Oryza meyeriana var. granulata]